MDRVNIIIPNMVMRMGKLFAMMSRVACGVRFSFLCKDFMANPKEMAARGM